MARAVRPGGKIVCLAPCGDGLGNEEFRSLMALAARVLSEAPGRPGAGAIDRALRIVQEAAMKDFKIGKQKPVDLLLQLRHAGWGNLYLLCDGLSPEDRRLLPFRYLGDSDDDPAARLRAWVRDRDRRRKPTYVLIDDPTIWIRPASPGVPPPVEGPHAMAARTRS